MSKLKLAVVGAGHLGRIHAKLLSEMPDVELVGVVDPVEAARDRVAADCRTQSIADQRHLIGKIDGAIIATPTQQHHAVALDFLRRGIPLLIEKPLAGNLAEAEDLVTAAENSGATLQVGHIERFNPAFVAAAAQVRQPRYVEAVRASGYTGRSTDIGVVYDLMIHDIDLLLSLVHAPLASVQALGVAVLGRHEDAVQARLAFADGTVANLSASRVSYQAVPKRQMQIWWSQGFAAIDFGARTAQVVRPSQAVLHREYDYNSLSSEDKTAFKDRLFTDILPVESLEIESSNALADELRDFADCIRTGSTPRVTGHHGRNAIAVAEAILDSVGAHSWSGIPGELAGPLATPTPTILRGPHWQSAPLPHTTRREAG